MSYSLLILALASFIFGLGLGLRYIAYMIRGVELGLWTGLLLVILGSGFMVLGGWLASWNLSVLL